MLFPTFDYFVFLPVVAALHQLLPGARSRTGWLLLASLVFYMAWNPADTLLLLTVVAAAFGAAQAVHAADEGRKSTIASVASVLIASPLLFYKYTGFVLENLRLVWPDAPAAPDTHLPIGVSFYTFQAIAYVIDVRRAEAPERNPVRFCTFLLFFPHLVAGPILRASTLLAQLREARSIDRADVGAGMGRLATGLVKKVLVADVLRVGMVDSVFTDPSSFTGLEVLVALYAYSLQIYCDFSGYTDFAIGSARLFGFRIPENFDRPYQALSVANYWRRWHMTLSDWVRDYVYLPMGGSRGGGWKPYRNTFATLMILGVWHGANWTFVVYGLIHGCAVSLNRWWRKSGPGRRPLGGASSPGAAADVAPGVLGTAWRWILTFNFVVLARILFRADDLRHAWSLVEALINFSWSLPRFSVHAWIVLLVGYAAHFTPRAWVPALRERFTSLPAPVWGAAVAGAACACVRWGIGDSLTFIYYDF